MLGQPLSRRKGEIARWRCTILHTLAKLSGRSASSLLVLQRPFRGIAIYRGCFLTWSAFILWLPDRRPPSHECSRNRAFMHYAPSNAARARLGDLDWMGRQCLAVHFGGGKAEVAQHGRGDVDQ